jgi:fucose permease
LVVLGIVVMVLPFGSYATMAGLLLVGLGCAPIYPCIIHSTPAHFGEENSQAMVGVQMASAYSGSLLMPLIFGLIANHISAALLPLVMGIIAVMMILMCERLTRIGKE